MMIPRIVSSSILMTALACLPIFSRDVSPGEVAQAAQRWCQIENRLSRLRLAQDGLCPGETRELKYNDVRIGWVTDLKPTGFILSPAVTELAPVSFISFSGRWEDLAQHPFLVNLQSRLRQTVLQLDRQADENHRQNKMDKPAMNDLQVTTNRQAWEQLLDSRWVPQPPTANVPPMLHSTWYQQYPYNIYTPLINYVHAPTGCSATAQAQIMYYWRYPTAGQGNHSYTWKGSILSADFNHPYYWQRMLDHYQGKETTEQYDAVARLMSDIGISIDMNYGLGGSGAYPNDNDSLTTFFKYSTDILRVDAALYLTPERWFTMFRNQMDHGWPVLLATYRPQGGHAIVIDGYRVLSNLNQIHANMGWAGAYDNYYTLDNIDGYGSTDDYAVANIHPTNAAGATRTLTVHSTPAGSYVQVHPVDINGQGSGQAEFTRAFANGLEATVRAALHNNQSLFTKWVLDGTDYADRKLAFTMSADRTAEAVFSPSSGTVVDLAQSLDNPPFNLTTGGDGAMGGWIGQTAVFFSVGSAARSGDIAANQSSYLQAQIQGPGVIEFQWKVSSDDYDLLKLYIDNAFQAGISGEIDWHRRSFFVPPGAHTLRWAYEKDPSVDKGSDCGWLDQPVFHPFSYAAPVINQISESTGTGNASSVHLSGNFAYIAQGAAGLRVVDISDPTAPVTVATFKTTGPANDLAISGNTVLVAEGEAGLEIIDVANPHRPALVGSYDTLGVAEGIAVKGNCAFVADGIFGLVVIDILDRAKPVFVSNCYTGRPAHQVQVVGSYAYVAASEQGLMVIDVSDAAYIRVKATCHTQGNAIGVFVRDGMAYVSDSQAGLQVINLANIWAPTLVGACSPPGEAGCGLFAGSHYVFLPSGSAGLQVIDVLNPALPTIVGSYATTGRACGACFDGSHIFVADGDSSKLIILEMFGGRHSVVFPRFSYQPGVTIEGYGFVNPTADPALVMFSARDTDGAAVGSCNPMIWEAGAQGAYQGEGLMGLTQQANAWVEAEMSQDRLLGFFLSQRYEGALTAMDGAGMVTAPCLDGIFPRVVTTGEYNTEIFLVNPSSTEVQVTLSCVGKNGPAGAVVRLTPPGAVFCADVKSLFSQTSDFDGFLRVQGTGGLMGNAVIRYGTQSISSINLQPVASAAETLVAPHITLSPGTYYTEVNLINPFDIEAQGTLSPINADGTPMSAPFTVTIPAQGMVTLRDTELGLPAGVNREGWLRISGNGSRLLGCLTFGDPVANRYESTLPLQADGSAEIYFAQVANGRIGGTDFFTGLALVNPNLTAVDVTIRDKTSDGSLLGSTTLSLAPGVKYIRLLRGIEGFEHLPDQASGYIHITASAPLFAFELFGDNGLTFLSAVPAQH